MNYLSLFSGAGGMDLGLHAAGFVCRLAVESDPHACNTFARNFPDVPLVRRPLTVADGDGPPPPFAVDLVAGGPSCQPFSQAGKGLGQFDARDCFPAMLALVGRTKPRAVLVENVPGLLSPKHRGYLDTVLGEFARLGYAMRHCVINAADMGIPQTRKRVFLVGFHEPDCAARFRWPEPTHSQEALVHAKWIDGRYWDALGMPDTDEPSRAEVRILVKLRAGDPDSLARAKLLRWRTVRDAIGDLMEFAPGWGIRCEQVGASTRALDEPGFTLPGAGQVYTAPLGLRRTKNTRIGKGVPVAASTDHDPQPLSAQARDYLDRHPEQIHTKKHPPATADSASPTVPANVHRGAPYGLLDVASFGRGSIPQSCRPLMPDAPSDSVQAASPRSVHPPVLAVRNRGAGDGNGSDFDSPGPTVPAVSGGQTGLDLVDAMSMKKRYFDAGGREHVRPAPSATLRRLTQRECARLQAFPDDFVFEGGKTAAYRQCGNALCPPLAQVVARAIRAALGSGEGEGP